MSSQELPEGELLVELAYTHKGKGGTAQLLVDGQQVAVKKLTRTMTGRIAHEGLDVGLDRYSAVGKGYQAPFPYTGHIGNVTYRIDPQGETSSQY